MRNLKFYESENFSNSSLHRVFESENFRFPFNYEKWPNLGSKMSKIRLQKIVAGLLEKLRKLYMNGTAIYKFLAVLKLQTILSNICFSEQIFYRKQSLGAPVNGTITTTHSCWSWWLRGLCWL